MKHRKIRLLFAALILTLAGAGAVYAFTGTEQDSIRIAQVNGMNVSALEFRRELDRQRASVIDYFHRTYGAKFTESFWDTRYGGESPEEVVKDRAMEELAERKVELALGSRYGLLSSTAYEDLLEEMDKENKRRAEAAKARLPVYGPVNMDEAVFLSYYMSKLRNGLKEKITAEELGVTEEELLRLQELERNPPPPETDRVLFQKLAVPYRDIRGGGNGSQSAASAAEPLHELKQCLEQAAQSELPSGGKVELPSGDRVEQSSPITGTGVLVTMEELNKDTASTYFKSQPVLYSVLAGGLKEGQASPVFDEALQGQLVLVKVLERKSGSSGDGGDGGEQAGAALSLDSLYLRHIGQLAAAAEVILYRDEYDRIKMK